MTDMERFWRARGINSWRADIDGHRCSCYRRDYYRYCLKIEGKEVETFSHLPTREEAKDAILEHLDEE